MSGPSSNEARGPFKVEEIHAEFERLLADRHDIGLRNLLSNTILEPRNPFQKANRKPQRWIVAVGGICILALMILVYFHWR